MFFKTVKQCIQDGTHLVSCDDDGYCVKCGHQEDTTCPRCGEPKFSDEDCDCKKDD